MQKNRLKKHYDLIVRYDSMIQLPLINAAETPEISHIILNKGLGNKAVVDRKRVLPSALALELISGQRPYITEAKKSIDKFKLRQGMPIGCKVTLRGSAAYLFLDRLMLRIFPKITTSQKTHGGRSKRRRRPSAAGGVSKYKPGIRSVAYGMRDLYVYEEILRIGEVDEHLGGFDIVCVYRRRSRPFFHNPSSASSLTSTRRRGAEVADSDNSSLLAFGHNSKSRRRCCRRRVSPGRANLFNEWLRLEE
jgi:Ribosomal protein L5|eukprot:c19085_g1_i1.p1 GENE.c19085_g1_i1~~c19085_g1_i1.p1  ORF type:complete len:249 (-),score=-32.80 c19085_g1_i1:539-1285(-)